MEEVFVVLPEKTECSACRSEYFGYGILEEDSRHVLYAECKDCGTCKKVAEVTFVTEEKLCNCILCSNINAKYKNKEVK